MLDVAPDTVVGSCSQVAPLPTATPWIRFVPGAMLVDGDLRTTYAANNIPAPTPSELRFGVGVVGDGAVYTGGARLTITSGSLRLFTDATCAALLGGAADPWSAGEVVVDNARLTSGVPVHVLGAVEGNVSLTLTLDPDPAFDIQPPAVANAPAVTLTLELYTRPPADVVMSRNRAIRNGGRHIGVPATPAVRSSRVKVRARASSPGGHGGTLRIHVGAGDANKLALYSAAEPIAQEQDQIGVAFPDANTIRWLAGTIAEPNGVTVGLALVVAGIALEFGDCVRVLPVTQGLTSIGIEWENNPNLVERRHDATDHLIGDHRAWEGLPSKATVFRSARLANGVAIAMRVDTEVSHAHQTYSEIVIGPTYDYTALEAQLAEVKRFVDEISFHRICTSRLPANVTSREVGHYADVLYAQGQLITFANGNAQFGGTMQGTFAVPIWALSTQIATLDEDDGAPAKADAETWAGAHDGVDDACIGLITACQYYINLFDGAANLAADDGPKTRCPVMFRTDFRAMHAQLTAPQQAAFLAWSQGHAQRAARLLPNGYSNPLGAQHGPLIGTWLDSVIAGAAAKDDMSPPPGYPRHGTGEPIPYAMGLLGVDPTTQNIIAEHRTTAQAWQRNQLDGYFTQVFAWAARLELGGAPTWAANGGAWGPARADLPPRRRGQGTAYTHIRADPADPNS